MMYVQVDIGLRRHRKFRRLTAMLGCKPADAIALLFDLWALSLEREQSGDVGPDNAEDLAYSLEWPGSPDMLRRALIECGGSGSGFLDTHEGRLTVHNYEAVYGPIDHKRDYNRERARQKRMESSLELEQLKRKNAELAQRCAYVVTTSPQPSDNVVVTEAHSIAQHNKDSKDSCAPGANDAPGKRVQPTPKNAEPPDFAPWYDTYPKKKNKPDALKAWRALHQKDRDKAAADIAAGRFACTEYRFIPYPASYLRAHSWQDPPDPSRNGSGPALDESILNCQTDIPA